MTIYNYVKKYDYTFEEKPFNEVDNIVLSTLAYVNFNNILNGKMTLKDLSEKYFNISPKLTRGEIIAVKEGVKLLKSIQESKRFKDILAYNYVYEGDDESQFGALTFDLGDTLCIAYEGTDALMSGWEEDFKMAYMFPVKAHKKAIKYLNKYLFTNKKIILVGHSKGGNLALVAGMYANIFIKWKIINIYSNDGQGLRNKEMDSRKFKSIRNKYIHIIPQNSIVGLLFRHSNDVVIKSNAITLFSHAPSTWKVIENSFERTKLVKSSDVFDRSLSVWLNKYDEGAKERFVCNVFDILKTNDITSLVQVKSNPLEIFKIVKSSNMVTKETLSMINDLIKTMNKIDKD